MIDPTGDARGAVPNARLAIDGGEPAVPDGPPDWPPGDERIRDQLLRAWTDGTWGRYYGGFVEQLASGLAEMVQVQHALPTCSGTFAVELALRGLKVKPGDEVVLAAYDFPGNFRAIEAVGATPVLADIEPRSWALDPDQLQAALGPATRAVVVSHLHGGLADMQQLTRIAHQRGVAVVEDACQAPGAEVQGKPAGSWGDVGVLSFGGSKLLTAGRGGAVLTDDPQILQRAKIYSERGNDAFPLSQLQAAVLLPQLASLAQHNERRKSSVARLETLWSEIHVLESVRADQQPGTPSYYKVALCYDRKAAGGHSRDEFVAAMMAEGVAVGAGFRGFLRRSPRRCRSVGKLTHAARAAEATVLMHHPALLGSDRDIMRIGEAYRKVDAWFRRDPATCDQHD